MAPKLAASLSGASGVYWVCMQLSLRGLLAMPTIRNTAGIDVLVSTASGVSADLQVKTAQRTVGFWPTQAPDQIVVSPHVFFVFVRWRDEQRSFEGFLVPSGDVRERVLEHAARKEARGLKPFHSWRLPADVAAQNKLSDAWETWSPDGVARGCLL
jgi:hypothetical protein